MATGNQNLIEETVQLVARDGGTISGYRVRPAGAVKGGLIVLQEIFGLTDQMKSVVQFYAGKGYDAIFPCFYDRNEPGLVVPFNDPDRGRTLAYGLNMDEVTADIAAAAKTQVLGIANKRHAWEGCANQLRRMITGRVVDNHNFIRSASACVQ